MNYADYNTKLAAASQVTSGRIGQSNAANQAMSIADRLSNALSHIQAACEEVNDHQVALLARLGIEYPSTDPVNQSQIPQPLRSGAIPRIEDTLETLAAKVLQLKHNQLSLDRLA